MSRSLLLEREPSRQPVLDLDAPPPWFPSGAASGPLEELVEALRVEDAACGHRWHTGCTEYRTAGQHVVEVYCSDCGAVDFRAR